MSDPTEPELPRALALAWGVAAAPQRGPKREMSVERIVEAAMEIADESGLGAVSMAAVAGKFDMTPMALYRYVSAKDDLTLLMFEYGIGLPPSVVEGADWRAGIDAWARAQLRAYNDHPWLLDVAVDGPPLTPHGLAWADNGVAALEGSGLTGPQRLSAILAVNGQVRWIATLLRGAGGDLAIEGDQLALMRHLITAHAYPWYHDALFGEGEESDSFEFAMQVVIEGIAAVADGRAPLIAPLEVLSEEVRKDRRVREARQRRRERERELQHSIREERDAVKQARDRERDRERG